MWLRPRMCAEFRAIDWCAASRLFPFTRIDGVPEMCLHYALVRACMHSVMKRQRAEKGGRYACILVSSGSWYVSLRRTVRLHCAQLLGLHPQQPPAHSRRKLGPNPGPFAQAHRVIVTCQSLEWHPIHTQGQTHARTKTPRAHLPYQH